MLDLSPLAHFGLLLVRPGMLMLLAPGIGGVGVPAQARLGLTVLLALALFPSVAIPRGDGNAIVTAIIAREAVIGLSLAFVVRALIAGAEFAGHMSGFQIGFSYGATIDPQNWSLCERVTVTIGLVGTNGPGRTSRTHSGSVLITAVRLSTFVK